MYVVIQGSSPHHWRPSQTLSWSRNSYMQKKSINLYRNQWMFNNEFYNTWIFMRYHVHSLRLRKHGVIVHFRFPIIFFTFVPQIFFNFIFNLYIMMDQSWKRSWVHRYCSSTHTAGMFPSSLKAVSERSSLFTFPEHQWWDFYAGEDEGLKGKGGNV